jgi:hypothetical protein
MNAEVTSHAEDTALSQFVSLAAVIINSPIGLKEKVTHSVADPDPYVFGPPGSASGSTSQRYGSGFFYNQAKIVRKPLIPIVFFYFFMTFYL